MRWGRALILAAAALLAWCGAAGQGPRGADSAAAPRQARARFWIRPVASLLVPGSGQLLGAQDRGAVYIATELYVLARFLQSNHDGHRERDRFRALAFDVARRDFSVVRRDTVFEYYETMQRFTSSGQFDRDAGPAFVPEGDSTTFNGSVWLLARRTFWKDPNAPPDATSPEYQRALQFYRTRAVGPDFLWSWRDRTLEQQVFRETIRKSDTAFRRAQTQLGLMLANHVASAVDALISRRLSAAAHRPATIRTTLGSGGPGGRATVVRLAIAF